MGKWTLWRKTFLNLSQMEGLQSPVLQMAVWSLHIWKEFFFSHANPTDKPAEPGQGLYTSKNVSFLESLTVFPLKKKKKRLVSFLDAGHSFRASLLTALLCWNASVIWTIIFSCRSISCPISSCDSRLMCRILVFYWAPVLILSDLLICIWYFNVLRN